MCMFMGPYDQSAIIVGHGGEGATIMCSFGGKGSPNEFCEMKKRK